MLKNEIERLRSDLRHAQEQVRELTHSNTAKDHEISNFKIRYEVAQNDVNDKVMQLETCLSQLEKAELKAAKEARERLDLERTVRRFKSTGGATMAAHDMSTMSVNSNAAASVAAPTVAVTSRSNAVSHHSEHRSSAVNESVSVASVARASTTTSNANGQSRLSLNDFVSRYDPKLTSSAASAAAARRHSDDLEADVSHSVTSSGRISPERPGNNFHIKDFLESKRSRAMNSSELNISNSNSAAVGSRSEEFSGSRVTGDSASARIDAIMKNKGWKVKK